MFDRRQLLLRGGTLALFGAAGVRLSASPLLFDPDEKQRVLVLLQLSGGNDGLSLVVPYADDAYGRARSATRLTASEVERLDESRGLHPALSKLAGRFRAGKLAIVEGVGYPEPNRSHFKSLEIWHSADARGRAVGSGWVARLAQRHFGTASTPNRLVHIGGEVPFSLHGGAGSPVSFSVPQGYRWVGEESELERLSGLDPAQRERAAERSSSDDALDFVRGVMRDAHASSREVRAAAAAYSPAVEYPNSALGDALRAAAALVHASLGSRVISLDYGGFDTHNDQAARLRRQYEDLDPALEAFLKDIERGPQRESVLLFAFSEFGRRVEENGSRGTDHGTAGPALLAGAGVRGGFHGRTPSLRELDDGDLVHTTDFRAIYATLIEDWFGAKAEPILGARFPKLALLG